MSSSPLQDFEFWVVRVVDEPGSTGIAHLRSATEEDVSALVEIESTAAYGRWNATAFARELTLAWSRTEVVALGRGGLVVGFMVYWVVADEVQLLNIATRVDYQRRGIGALMMERLRQSAQVQGAKRIFLEVRSLNLGAQVLYRRCGFEATGTRRGYYGDDGDDALLMELALAE